jgi:hypothetical protein
VTVKSLSVVNLAMLADFAGRKSDGQAGAVTEKF